MFSFTAATVVPSKRDIPSDFSPPRIPQKRDRHSGKGGPPSKATLSKEIDLSVFDILNIFRRRWFLSRDSLLSHVISAQKAEDGKISWAEFDPPFHSHLVKCAVALVPHPVPKVKKVMFVYILELLNGEGHEAFFNLQKGGRKANHAQKEKRRLARKRSRASKREREREAAKAALLSTRERQCVACGRKFESRKTAKKHKCPHSKVIRVPKAAATGQASPATPTATGNQPQAMLTSPTLTAITYNDSIPAVTGDLQEMSLASSRAALIASWNEAHMEYLKRHADSG
jgi:predicted RNA-binding Zn-ribbon protein involved in translation (DUF1610 family)